MKILFVNHSASLTGAPISCFNLITRLGSGFVPVFASAEKGPVIDELEKKGIRTYVVSNKGLLGLGYIKAFIKIIKSEKAGALHLNTLTSFCKYAAIAGFVSRVPVVWVVRENPLISRSRRLRFWLRMLSSRIVFVDRDTREKLLPDMSKNIELIYNGVDIEAFRPLKSDFILKKFNIEPSQRLVGYIGLITERKGLEYLIKAFSIIKGRYEDVKLIIIGGHKSNDEPYFIRIKELIRKLSLEKEVFFTGVLSDVALACNNLDIVLLPSLEERCSRSLLESLACAKAVVATRVGGTPEIIEDGQNGILVEAKNESQIAEAVLKLLTDDGMRTRMGLNGRLKAERDFDIGKNINRMKELYLGLINS